VAPRRRKPLSLERRVLLLAIAGAAPSFGLAVWLLWRSHVDALTTSTLLLTAGSLWVACAVLVHDRVTRPMQTLSNLLAALREGDFTIRARGADPDSAMGLALHEVNTLTDLLRRERLEAREATALLRHVMDSIDVALFAFDGQRRLRLMNREAESLIGVPVERALGGTSAELGLDETLDGETPRIVELRLPGRAARLELRHGIFRQDGRPHRLVVLSDLTRPLREEERQAWLRLVRVLSHEINNSLAPIQSIAGSLRVRLGRTEGASADPALAEGLELIEKRARSLGRFMSAYARLARLPEPQPSRIRLEDCVRAAAGLEERMPIAIAGGPSLELDADGDQLEQLLINLLRNAVDAALETGGGVRVLWGAENGWAEIRIEDEGPGIAETSNLFVPFFTTKPEGTGIGLALSRQIAEAHGGQVVLENRDGHRGAVARVRLPLRSVEATERA
jgi:nitrogen fixation/metabolism regulation signal transduction histidine kinase